jgi:hypothetical protein
LDGPGGGEPKTADSADLKSVASRNGCDLARLEHTASAPSDTRDLIRVESLQSSVLATISRFLGYALAGVEARTVASDSADLKSVASLLMAVIWHDSNAALPEPQEASSTSSGMTAAPPRRSPRTQSASLPLWSQKYA